MRKVLMRKVLMRKVLMRKVLMRKVLIRKVLIRRVLNKQSPSSTSHKVEESLKSLLSKKLGNTEQTWPYNALKNVIYALRLRLAGKTIQSPIF